MTGVARAWVAKLRGGLRSRTIAPPCSSRKPSGAGTPVPPEQPHHCFEHARRCTPIARAVRGQRGCTARHMQGYFGARGAHPVHAAVLQADAERRRARARRGGGRDGGRALGAGAAGQLVRGPEARAGRAWGRPRMAGLWVASRRAGGHQRALHRDAPARGAAGKPCRRVGGQQRRGRSRQRVRQQLCQLRRALQQRAAAPNVPASAHMVGTGYMIHPHLQALQHHTRQRVRALAVAHKRHVVQATYIQTRESVAERLAQCHDRPGLEADALDSPKPGHSRPQMQQTWQLHILGGPPPPPPGAPEGGRRGPGPAAQGGEADGDLHGARRLPAPRAQRQPRAQPLQQAGRMWACARCRGLRALAAR